MLNIEQVKSKWFYLNEARRFPKLDLPNRIIDDLSDEILRSIEHGEKENYQAVNFFKDFAPEVEKFLKEKGYTVERVKEDDYEFFKISGWAE